LAHKHHIYLHPTLFVGGEVGEAYWDVPWRLGRNPQADPEMLRLETNHAQEFGRRYAHETAILAWDLTDEPPFWIAADTSDAMAVNWTRLIAGGLRKFDKMHPIVVGVSTLYGARTVPSGHHRRGRRFSVCIPYKFTH
jgi:endo-1,4-beta-mannosidase